MGVASSRQVAGQAVGQFAAVQRTAQVLPTKAIGDVLKELKPDFPDVTVSKIRFLESEGLISPRRSASGYRRFAPEDISRLRFILTLQRDNYLPLKVIKDQLDAMDSGNVTPVVTKQDVTGPVSAEQMRAAASRRLTRMDVVARAGVEEGFVNSAIHLGLIAADPSGFFSVDDVQVVQLAFQLTQHGFDGRHLKSLLTLANRQLDMISAVTAPVAHARDENARQRSVEKGREVSALLISLNAALLKGNLG